MISIRRNLIFDSKKKEEISKMVYQEEIRKSSVIWRANESVRLIL